MSKENNIPVYHLNGDKFYAFVRCISLSNSQFENLMFCNLEKDFYSFSYIGDRNIGVLGISEDSIIVLYDQINPNYIIHVFHDDIGSLNFSKIDPYSFMKINEIHTPNSLLYDTSFYNELVIKKEKDGIKPSGIVCFDLIKEKDLTVAHKYNLPIILINSNKYFKQNGFPQYDDNDNYNL